MELIHGQPPGDAKYPKGRQVLETVKRYIKHGPRGVRV